MENFTFQIPRPMLLFSSCSCDPSTRTHTSRKESTLKWSGWVTSDFSTKRLIGGQSQKIRFVYLIFSEQNCGSLFAVCIKKKCHIYWFLSFNDTVSTVDVIERWVWQTVLNRSKENCGMRWSILFQDNKPTFACEETHKTTAVVRQRKRDSKKLPPIYHHVVCVTIDGVWIGK
jgi:hypothetical protein